MKNDFKNNDKFIQLAKQGISCVLIMGAFFSNCPTTQATSIKDVTYLQNIETKQLDSIYKKGHEGVNLYVNNKSFMPLDEHGNSVKVYLFDGSTYLPIRAITKMCSGNIEWNNYQKEVSIIKGDNTLVNNGKLDDFHELTEVTVLVHTGISIKVDNVPYILTDAQGNIVEPLLINGTLYGPLRPVTNIFDVEVRWDAKSHSVYISKTIIKDDIGLLIKEAEDALNLILPYSNKINDRVNKTNDMLIEIDILAGDMSSYTQYEVVKNFQKLYQEIYIKLMELSNIGAEYQVSTIERLKAKYNSGETLTEREINTLQNIDEFFSNEYLTIDEKIIALSDANLSTYFERLTAYVNEFKKLHKAPKVKKYILN